MSPKSARTPEGDARFFAALENGHSVRAACEASGYVRPCTYRWRKQDKEFAERWADALHIAGDLLEEEADRRGRDGYDEPVYYQGQEAGAKRKYSDALLLARLKAVRPEHYRERIVLPTVSQQSITVVIRDFDEEDHMLRLVAERKLAEVHLPPHVLERWRNGDRG